MKEIRGWFRNSRLLLPIHNQPVISFVVDIVIIWIWYNKNMNKLDLDGKSFSFDLKIDLLYGLNYCMNREKGELKPYNTTEKTKIIEDFYTLYSQQSDVDTKQIAAFGDFQQIAKKALSEHSVHFPVLEQYLMSLSPLKQRVTEDFLRKPGLNEIQFSQIKSFFGFSLSDSVNIYLSFFVSGGFGFFLDNKSVIVLGVKYDKVKDQYGTNGTLVCKIIHEFAHPYVKKAINGRNIVFVNNDNVPYYYANNKAEEVLTRVVEIIFSGRIFGQEYINWAVEEQRRDGFWNVGGIVEKYIENRSIIQKFDDLLELAI